MKVLLTGANGQLGRCLVDRLQQNDTIEFSALDKQSLDIGNIDQVKAIAADIKPDVIINAAAYTGVDKAESEVESARRVNEIGAANLAKAAANLGVPLIHVSTDYVFDGLAKQPYKETDATGPTGVYGQTKLAGEDAVQAICAKHIILRTAWVYSEYGSNFVKTMLRLAETRDELNVLEDQTGCPTYAGDIADAILKICLNISTNPDWGVYHYVGATQCTWAEFARTIFREAETLGILVRQIAVRGIPSSDYPTPAERPKYSVLHCQKVKNTFDVSPIPLTQSLPRMLAALKYQQD
jgi:dTDP-4-dehydrorhamnose reductase